MLEVGNVLILIRDALRSPRTLSAESVPRVALLERNMQKSRKVVEYQFHQLDGGYSAPVDFI